MHDCIIEEHLTYVLRSLNSTDLTNTKKKETGTRNISRIEYSNMQFQHRNNYGLFCWLYSPILHSGHSAKHNIDSALDFRIHAFKHLA